MVRSILLIIMMQLSDLVKKKCVHVVANTYITYFYAKHLQSVSTGPCSSFACFISATEHPSLSLSTLSAVRQD